jgi:hypothetical protein
LAKEPEACFDHLGRSITKSKTLTLTSAPTYVILANDSRPDLFPCPAASKLLGGYPSPVVLQALPPQKDVVLKQSAYRLAEAEEAMIPLYAYNFGTNTVSGKLKLSVPQKWRAQALPEISIAPGERKEVVLRLQHPKKLTDKDAKVRVTGQFGDAGTAVLAFRLTTLKD